MVKALILFFAAFSLCISSSRCLAQDVVPIIYLSIDEAAKAKQTAQDFVSAQDRNNRAMTAWRSFNEVFQAANPELPGLRFSSDFRVAFAMKNRSNSYPFETEAVTIELSPEERKKAESLHQEMSEARRLLDQAQKNWVYYQHQFLFDHVPPNPRGWRGHRYLTQWSIGEDTGTVAERDCIHAGLPGRGPPVENRERPERAGCP